MYCELRVCRDVGDDVCVVVRIQRFAGSVPTTVAILWNKEPWEVTAAELSNAEVKATVEMSCAASMYPAVGEGVK